MRAKKDQSLWEKAIRHALASGRLQPTQWRGAYVIGVPQLTKHGRIRAAQLALANDAVLVDDTAGGVWQIWKPRDRDIHLSVPAVGQRRKRDGIRVHRRSLVPLAQRAGLDKPQSQRRFGPHRVDVFFPDFNLVVECDSLRYHRTVQQQQEDCRRDHVHLLDGRTSCASPTTRWRTIPSMW